LEFLETLLIILIVVVSIRVFWRYFGKEIIKYLGMKALHRIQKSFEKRAGFQEEPDSFHSSGNKVPKEPMFSGPLKSSEKKKEGEYIDFEEID
jgi:hypothetical protein